MEPRIVDRAAFVVVGLRIVTRPMSPEIPALWPRFMARAHEIGGVLESRVTYGVMQMDDGGGLVYLAGMSVADAAAPVPDGMSAIALPAATYAAFAFPFTEIAAAFDAIFGTWLPTSGRAQAASPMFERYGEAFDPAVPSSPMEVFVPVRARGA